MVRAIEQLRQAMEACELGALSLPDQIDALMDAGKEVLQEISTLTPPNEWVAVEERLPKYNIREDGELISSKILCYCETDKTVHLVVSQKFYTGRKGEIVHPVFRYYDEWGDEIENVSHWMPLPERPKEE